jgi:sugar phosphate isomerase/epimerase
VPDVVLSTASFFPDTQLGFRMAAECGYDGVEVMVNHDRRSQSVASVQGLSAHYGVPVVSVHVPCLVVSQHVWGWSPELKLRRSVEMAAAVGADVVVVHPPFRWQRAYADGFARLVAMMDGVEGGPRIAVENMFTVQAFGRRVDPYRCTEDPALGAFSALTLDTSHVAAARQDLMEMYRSMAGRVRHLHLSDSTATRGDEHLPPGTGILPLEELASAMVADAFGGRVVLEVAIGRLPDGSRTAATADSCHWARVAFGP